MMSKDKRNAPEQPDPAESNAGETDSNAEVLTGSDPSEMADEFLALHDENKDLKNRLLLLAADMENLRRRTEREKQDSAKYAISNFARDVLTIGDNLNRALQALPADARETADEAFKALLDGVEMTEREMVNVLSRHGVEIDDPKGSKFDPNLHQAIFELENPDVPSGTVVEVVQTGYVIGDRVLRPAMVGVSKGGPKVQKLQPIPDGDSEVQVEQEVAQETYSETTAKPGADSQGDANAGSDPAKMGKKLDRSA